jgi:hypothetical protein
VAAGIAVDWAAGDEVYGRSTKLALLPLPWVPELGRCREHAVPGIRFDC